MYTMGVLCAIPIAIFFAILNAYQRRKLRRLLEKRNRLWDEDREQAEWVQRQLSEWTGRLHPRKVKELDAAHPSKKAQLAQWQKEAEQRRRKYLERLHFLQHPADGEDD